MFIVSIDCGTVSMAYSYVEVDSEFNIIDYIKLHGLNILEYSNIHTDKIVAKDRSIATVTFYKDILQPLHTDYCIIERQMPGTESYDVSIILHALYTYNGINVIFADPKRKNKVKYYEGAVVKRSSAHATNELHTYNNYIAISPPYKCIDCGNNMATLKYDIATAHIQLLCYLEDIFINSVCNYKS